MCHEAGPKRGNKIEHYSQLNITLAVAHQQYYEKILLVQVVELLQKLKF